MWFLLVSIAILSYVISLKWGEKLYKNENTRVDVLKDVEIAQEYQLIEEYNEECKNHVKTGKLTTFGLCFWVALVIHILISMVLLFLVFEDVIPFWANYEQINTVIKGCFLIGLFFTGFGLMERGTFLIERRNRLKEREELWKKFFSTQHYLRRGVLLIVTGFILVVLVFEVDRLPMF